MNSPSVCKPSLFKLQEYESFLEEYLTDQQSYYTMLRVMYEEAKGDIDKLVSLQIAQSKGEQLPDGWTPMTTLWMELEEKIIGQAVIRHELNCPVLEEFAGHVTYYILPSYRGKGYAKIFLKWIIGEARAISIKDLRLHCDQRNVASQKTIKAHKAQLIDVLDNTETWGEMTCRYRLRLE